MGDNLKELSQIRVYFYPRKLVPFAENPERTFAKEGEAAVTGRRPVEEWRR